MQIDDTLVDLLEEAESRVLGLGVVAKVDAFAGQALLHGLLGCDEVVVPGLLALAVLGRGPDFIAAGVLLIAGDTVRTWEVAIALRSGTVCKRRF